MMYANLGSRFWALVLDTVVLSLFFFPATRVVKGVWLMNATDHLWNYAWFVTDPLCLIFLCIIIVYFIFSEGYFGATAGKRLMHIRVIDVDGNHPGIWRATVRNLLRIVDSLPAFNVLGAVLILMSPERARFGDRIAGTRVIKS